MTITNRELRQLLTSIDDQDMTIGTLREILFHIPHSKQDEEIESISTDVTRLDRRPNITPESNS